VATLTDSQAWRTPRPVIGPPHTLHELIESAPQIPGSRPPKGKGPCLRTGNGGLYLKFPKIDRVLTVLSLRFRHLVSSKGNQRSRCDVYGSNTSRLAAEGWLSRLPQACRTHWPGLMTAPSTGLPLSGLHPMSTTAPAGSGTPRQRTHRPGPLGADGPRARRDSLLLDLRLSRISPTPIRSLLSRFCAAQKTAPRTARHRTGSARKHPAVAESCHRVTCRRGYSGRSRSAQSRHPGSVTLRQRP